MTEPRRSLPRDEVRCPGGECSERNGCARYMCKATAAFTPVFAFAPAEAVACRHFIPYGMANSGEGACVEVGERL